jgi:hypothetical protein
LPANCRPDLIAIFRAAKALQTKQKNSSSTATPPFFTLITMNNLKINTQRTVKQEEITSPDSPDLLSLPSQTEPFIDRAFFAPAGHVRSKKDQIVPFTDLKDIWGRQRSGNNDKTSGLPFFFTCHTHIVLAELTKSISDQQGIEDVKQYLDISVHDAVTHEDLSELVLEKHCHTAWTPQHAVDDSRSARIILWNLYNSAPARVQSRIMANGSAPIGHLADILNRVDQEYRNGNLEDEDARRFVLFHFNFSVKQLEDYKGRKFYMKIKYGDQDSMPVRSSQFLLDKQPMEKLPRKRSRDAAFARVPSSKFDKDDLDVQRAL